MNIASSPHTGQGILEDDADKSGQGGLDLLKVEDAEVHFEDGVHRGFVGVSLQHILFVRSIQIGMVAIALGLWQYLGSTSKTLFLTVGTPSATLHWLGAWATGGTLNHGRGWIDLGATMEEASLGYLMGVTVGVLLGAFLGSTKALRTFASPFIAMLNAFPKIALAPLFILIFGGSLSMKAYFVGAGTFFITFYAVFNGIKSIDPIYLHNARILGANRRWRIREVYWPAIVGWVTAGLRLTAAWSIAAAVIVELLVANTGMGFVINNGQQSADLPQVFGGLFIVSLVAVLIDRALLRISRRFSAWRLA
jgi:NitT/TauT family transport system permease protein